MWNCLRQISVLSASECQEKLHAGQPLQCCRRRRRRQLSVVFLALAQCIGDATRLRRGRKSITSRRRRSQKVSSMSCRVHCRHAYARRSCRPRLLETPAAWLRQNRSYSHHRHHHQLVCRRRRRSSSSSSSRGGMDRRRRHVTEGRSHRQVSQLRVCSRSTGQSIMPTTFFPPFLPSFLPHPLTHQLAHHISRLRSYYRFSAVRHCAELKPRGEALALSQLTL